MFVLPDRKELLVTGMRGKGNSQGSSQEPLWNSPENSFTGFWVFASHTIGSSCSIACDRNASLLLVRKWLIQFCILCLKSVSGKTINFEEYNSEYKRSLFPACIHPLNHPYHHLIKIWDRTAWGKWMDATVGCARFKQERVVLQLLRQRVSCAQDRPKDKNPSGLHLET